MDQDQGVGQEVKRLREAKGWSQTRLAVEADMSVSGISMIENGHRNLSTTTLAKLAKALEVEVRDLFPLGQAPLPDTEDLRRFAEIGELLERRHARRLRQVENPNDPHFRDATATANWIADVQEEADEVIRWIIEHGEVLAGTWEDLGMMAGVALFAENPVWLGEQRLKAMGEPDELTARRTEKTAADLEESRQELQKTANG